MLSRRLLGGLLAAALLFVSSGCGPLGTGKMTITAQLGDSAGLFVGNDVGILGVPVGKVTRIEPQGTSVRVTLEVDADQAIPADAGAAVVARSVATDRYIELTPVYSSGPKMADGANIALASTRTPVDFDTVLSALNTLATGIAGSGKTANAIGEVIDSGAAAVDGKGRLFNRSITSLAEAVNGVTGQRGDITGTLKSLDRLTTVIATNQSTVRTFIDQVSLAADQLSDERENIRTALRSLSSAIEVVSQFAEDNRARLTRSLDQSTALMQQIMEDRGSLVDVLKVMPLALQNLQRAYSESDGAVRVTLDPTFLTPLGGLVETVCTQLPIPAGTCSQLGPVLFDLEDLLDTGDLLGSLGGGQ